MLEVRSRFDPDTFFLERSSTKIRPFLTADAPVMPFPSHIGELAPPDQKRSGKQCTKKQEDKDSWFRWNPYVAYCANDSCEDPDRNGNAGSLATPSTQSRQHKE
jgi:hypothetical protein